MNNQRQKGNVKRTDIRIPLPLYEELQKIAVERFNAPIHHISGKPEISSTLLELVRYGIQYLQLGLTAPYTDRVPDNINQRLEAIEQQLEQLVSSRLDSFSPKIQPLLAQKKEMEELFGCVASLRTENKILFKKVEKLEKLIASGNAANESESHKSDLPVTHLEDEKTSFEEATEEEDELHKGITYSTPQPIIEDPEDLSKGLTQKALCERIGENASNIGLKAKNFGKTPQQYLIEKTGWVYRDKKYYPSSVHTKEKLSKQTTKQQSIQRG